MQPNQCLVPRPRPHVCLATANPGLTAAWYFVWKGWYVAAVAVVIVALSGALALQARSIQRRQS